VSYVAGETTGTRVHGRRGNGVTPHARQTTLGPVSPRRQQDILIAYLLLIPAVVLVLGVLGYPLLWEIWLSMTDTVTERLSAQFIGLANYAELLKEPAFWRATADTLAYLVLTTFFKLAVGVAMALVLARPFPGRVIAFLAAFLPWAYPAGLGAVGWYWFIVPPLHTSYSELFGNLQYYMDSHLGPGTWGFIALVAFNIWRGGSFVGIFLLAALNGIPQDLFDYAVTEVKSGWRKFWMVTVPLLRPFLALAAFLSVVGAVADLGNVWEMSGYRDVYPIIWTYALPVAFNLGEWGRAAAWALILLPVLLFILFACYRLFDPLEEDQT